MNLKYVILLCVLTVEVKSDCGDYYKCLGGFVKDFFSGEVAGNRSDVNNDTELVDVENLRNMSVSFFDLSEIGKSLAQAVVDVTTLIKDEIKGVFNIEDQAEVSKKIENNTQIHVTAFNLSKIGENDTEETTSNETASFKIPDIIINNLTNFNDELNALRVQIEKNLQAELESFISQVLENDTVDWVEHTEISFLDDVLTTTEKPYPNSENDNKTITQIIDHNVDDIPAIDGKKVINSSTIVTLDSRIKHNENLNTNNTKLHINMSTTAVPFDLYATIDPFEIIYNITATAPTEVSSKSNSEQNIKSTETDIAKINRNSNVPPITTSNMIVSTTVKTSKLDDLTIKPATAKTTNKIPHQTQKENLSKQFTQTKTSIDFKQLENVAENEISNDDTSYYEIQDDNITDYPIIDYVELYKDTTNEDVDFVPTVAPSNEIKSDTENVIQNRDEITNSDNGYYTNDTSHPASIFPWVAAIFIKNGTNNQFDYYCDGTLLSESTVFTAARCLTKSNVTVHAADVIVFLGKRSLQASTDGETIHKVKQLKLHSNFSLQGEEAHNDLAALHLEDLAVFSEGIQPACLVEEGDVEEAVTTAWGEGLSLIRFEDKKKTCEKQPVENTFCATFGLTVALCPSYGGVYAGRQSGRWCASGVRSADPGVRGLCFDKTVRYTDLTSYREWIDEIMK